MSNITLLGLGNNKFTIVPAEISQMTGLQWVSFKDNQLTFLPLEIGRLRKLKRIRINYFLNRGNRSRDIRAVRTLVNLRNPRRIREIDIISRQNNRRRCMTLLHFEAAALYGK